MKRSTSAMTAAIVLLAAALRAPGLFTDFWLDEIWALSNVASIDSAGVVFTGIHHDGNHWLVSLWMYSLGNEAAFWLYRLPSFLAGVAAVLVAARLAEAAGAPRALSMLLVATSFPLVFYSSEARGYSLAALSGLVSVVVFLRWVERRDLASLLGFGIFASLGILSHLSVLIVLLALGLFSLLLVARGRLSLGSCLSPQAAPLATLALLFAVDLRHLTIGGGPRRAPGELLAQTASLAVGGPVELPEAWLFAGLCGAAVLAELLRRARFFWRERECTEPRPLLFLLYAAALAIPVWLALVLDPPFLFPRYFLVSVPFVPLLVAGLARASRPAWAFLLVALWLGVNFHSWVRFTDRGRGHYADALRDVVAGARGLPVTIGSDHDFRNGMIVDFYRARLGADGGRIRYLPRGEALRPDFWIAAPEAPPCRGCDLLRSYPSSPLSGAAWNLYRYEP